MNTHSYKHITAVTLVGTLGLGGCATSAYREAAPPQTATVVAVEEWDSCLQAPGAQTRPQRQAEAKAREQASKAAMSEEHIGVSTATAIGRPEAAAAVGVGAVQGVGVGITAGLMAGVKAGDPTDMVVGAVGGGIAGALLAHQDPEECYSLNRVTLKDASGKPIETWVEKKRDPSLNARPIKHNVLNSFPGGNQGSENMKPGDTVFLVHIIVPTSEQTLVKTPLTPEDFELYQQAMQKQNAQARS